MMKDSKSYDGYDSIRLDAHKIARKYWAIMHGSEVSYDEYMWIVSDIFGDYKVKSADPDSWHNFTTEHLDILRDNGVQLTREGTGEILRDETYLSQLKEDFIVAWNYWLQNRVDPMMRGAIIAYTKEQSVRFDNYSDKFWSRWAGGEGQASAGTTGIILGEKGSGKTDFALLLAEIFMRQGWNLITNIAIQSNIRYDYVRRFSSMLRAMAMSADKKKKSIVIIDELSVAGMRKQRAQKGTTLNMEDLDRLTRKMDCSMILVWHYDKDITTELKSTASFLAHKEGNVKYEAGRKRATVEFKITDLPEWHFISAIPSTTLQYHTNDVAPFSTDIKLSEVVDMVAELQEDPDSNLFRAIVEYVDSLEGDVQPISTPLPPGGPISL